MGRDYAEYCVTESECGSESVASVASRGKGLVAWTAAFRNKKGATSAEQAGPEPLPQQTGEEIFAAGNVAAVTTGVLSCFLCNGHKILLCTNVLFHIMPQVYGIPSQLHSLLVLKIIQLQVIVTLAHRS